MLASKVQLVQSVTHPGGKLFEAPNHQGQFTLGLGLLHRHPTLLFEAARRVFRPRCAAGIRQVRLPPRPNCQSIARFHAGDARSGVQVAVRCQNCLCGLGFASSAGEITRHPIRVLQQRTHPVPDRLLQIIASDLRMSHTAWSSNRYPSVPTSDNSSTRPSGSASTAEPSCHNKHSRSGGTPSDPAAANAVLPGIPACAGGFLQLHLSGLKHRWVNHGRHRNLDPLLARHLHPHTRPAAWVRMPPQGPQELGWPEHIAGMPVDGAPNVGRVRQHPAKRRGRPAGRPHG